MADPARRRGDKDLAEQARREAVPDLQPGAALAEFAGRHRLDGDEQVMEPAGAGQPGIEGGVEAARAVAAQGRAGLFEAQIAGEAFRADAGPAGEHPLEMERAEMHRRGDLVERRRVITVRRDMGDGRLDPAVVALRLTCVGAGGVGGGGCAGGGGGVSGGVGIHGLSSGVVFLRRLSGRHGKGG